MHFTGGNGPREGHSAGCCGDCTYCRQLKAEALREALKKEPVRQFTWDEPSITI
jgi:hypothetical protein